MAVIRKGGRPVIWLGLATAGVALLLTSLVMSLTGHTPTASAQAGCELTITKTADVDLIPEGGDINYDIVVTNVGTVACADVVVTDTLPADADCIDATATGAGGFTDADCNAAGPVVWTAADGIAADGVATLSLTLRLTSGADDLEVITNTVGVVAAAEATLPADATETVTVNDCDLTVSKDADDEVGEGGTIVYTITVENEGSADCANVIISEIIPTDTDCVDTAVVADESDVDVADAEGCDTSGTVTWEITEGTLDGLEPGEQAQVQMSVELTGGANEGDEIDNTACATSDDSDLENCDSLTIDVTEPAPTPTPTRTPTTQPTVQPPVVPTVSPPPPVVPTPRAVVAPVTGDGPSDSGFGLSLPLVLGLAGGVLLVSAGVARMRRVR